jgi:hypothetical protein
MEGDADIRTELQELAPGFTWPEAPAFRVPDGYFDSLKASVRRAISSSEIPLPHQTPYQAPAGYFETLSAAVLSRVRQQAPVVQLPRRRRASRIRWLAAAVIAAVIALAALLRLPADRATPSIDRQLASLSDATITQYLSTEATSLNEEDLYTNVSDSTVANPVVHGLSDRDIEEYLNEDSPGSY